METIQRVKKITQDIILDEELPQKMGPRFFPLIQDQLHQIINVLNSLESKITLLHFASQFPQALFLNKNGQIFSREQMLNKVNETNQTLNNIIANLTMLYQTLRAFKMTRCTTRRPYIRVPRSNT